MKDYKFGDVNLESVIAGRQGALESAMKKIRVDIGYITEDIDKGKLGKQSYQRLVQFQDELISAFESAAVLITLFTLRDFGPVDQLAESVDSNPA